MSVSRICQNLAGLAEIPYITVCQSGGMDQPSSNSAKWMLEAAEDPFAVVLARLRHQVGCSLYRLAEIGELDRPYLHRLENGTKTNPSRETVLKISAALIRSGADVLVIDRLLLASGNLPIFMLAGVPSIFESENQR
ncbi:helix-turn-helix domain-containing protein [Candidatus Lucifugimonas marina]|uniref:Helix-turn-helix domain-containing protein n=1 Tax=Candidatus Lucifugimonas marina TaxID=3038979 RepID=A0AAJ5ZHA1_9CHLR|nr:helix-turn-helix domain-containing protein [SAR202 cluster bacterium JH702]MDG0868287.1 helix-turn-helix domain-containing protein [SAR202 cluster bacterium JH639]WFG34931.1 helix-turn-helix domain-containing protein [SAR202 cluster bacterium JH545]WFG38882.1 helix-turn-helix domain-containing protein [SAR202 cluster bacterium JH1073]